MNRYVIAISNANEIAISDQVCDCDQVGVDHDKRLRSGECVPHHLTRDEQNDRDQGGV